MSNYITCNSYLGWVKDHLATIYHNYGRGDVFNLTDKEMQAVYDDWLPYHKGTFDVETYRFIFRITRDMFGSGRSYKELKGYLDVLEFKC